MTLFQAVLSALISSQNPALDAEELGRLWVIARAITDVSEDTTCYNRVDCTSLFASYVKREEVAAMLTMIAIRESGLSRRIHAGICHKNECDHGHAKGLWQVHQDWCVKDDKFCVTKELWHTSLSFEDTKISAYSASLKLARIWHKNPVHTITLYARGNYGAYKSAQFRADLYRKYVSAFVATKEDGV